MRHDRLLREEIVQRDLGLDLVRVRVGYKSFGRDHRQVDAFFCPAHRAKHSRLFAKVFKCLLLKQITPLGVLHLADVDHIVGAIQNEIDLRPFGVDVVADVPPCVDFGVHADNSKRLAHLFGVLKAQSLECETAPCGLPRGGDGVCPEMLVGRRVVQEAEVEEREVVDELVDAFLLFPAEEPVATDETALFKRLKGVRDGASIRDAGRRRQFAPNHARLLRGKRTHDLDVDRRVFEKRGVELGKLALERGTVGKEHAVEILGEAQSPRKVLPVVRDPADCHVAFRHVAPRHADASALHVEFALAEREGLEQDSRRHAIVKASLVSEKLFHDPGRRGAADDEKNVLSSRRPFVPEALKRNKEVRAGGVHPGELVDKDDFAFFTARGNDFFQRVKGVKPVFRLTVVCGSEVVEGLVEMCKLLPRGSVRNPRMDKGEAIRKCFTYQVGLPDASAPVDGNEFGFVRIVQLRQQLCFCCPSYHRLNLLFSVGLTIMYHFIELMSREMLFLHFGRHFLRFKMRKCQMKFCGIGGWWTSKSGECRGRQADMKVCMDRLGASDAS